MMPKKAHQLRGSKSSTGYPRRRIYVDVETYPETTSQPDEHVNVLHYGFAVFKDYQRDTERSIGFRTADEFWTFVDDNSVPKMKLWVYAHFNAFDMMVLAWHHEMVEKRGWTIGSKFLIGGPTIIELIHGEGSSRRCIWLVDSMNYFVTSLSNLGQSLGFPKGEFDFERMRDAVPGTDLWTLMTSYCQRDVRIVQKAIETLYELFTDNDLGPCAFSIAGLAFNSYRYRFLPTVPLYVHTNPTAIALERAAYMGGRTEPWWIGEKFTEEIYKLDVASMYPSVMKEMEYPTRLMAVIREDEYPSPEDLSEYINSGYLLVADIFVDIPDGTQLVPKRTERLIYPSGQFRTTLTTPELVLALKAGVVKRVYSAAVYKAASIFKEYVEFYFSLRQRYLEDGNKPFSEMCKLLLNALYGKFGQCNYLWEIPTDEDLATIEMIFREDPSLTVIDLDGRPVRRIGDHFEIRSPQRIEGYHSMPAVAAHVTAYARVRLSDYRNICGLDNVLYADTDSLFVTYDGYQRAQLAGLLPDTKTLGLLELEEKADSISIYGPKVYTVYKGRSSFRKIKGVKKRQQIINGEIVRDYDEPRQGVFSTTSIRNFSGAIRAGDLDRAITRTGFKQLRSLQFPGNNDVYMKGTVGNDGWTRPYYLQEIE